MRTPARSGGTFPFCFHHDEVKKALNGRFTFPWAGMGNGSISFILYEVQSLGLDSPCSKSFKQMRKACRPGPAMDTSSEIRSKRDMSMPLVSEPSSRRSRQYGHPNLLPSLQC